MMFGTVAQKYLGCWVSDKWCLYERLNKRIMYYKTQGKEVKISILKQKYVSLT